MFSKLCRTWEDVEKCANPTTGDGFGVMYPDKEPIYGFHLSKFRKPVKFGELSFGDLFAAHDDMLWVKLPERSDTYKCDVNVIGYNGVGDAIITWIDDETVVRVM